MSKFQIGDTAIGCYERDGHVEPTYSLVVGILGDGMIEVLVETPYGEDRLIIPESQVCSLNCCHTCVHRLSQLISGWCPATYQPIK